MTDYWAAASRGTGTTRHLPDDALCCWALFVHQGMYHFSGFEGDWIGVGWHIIISISCHIYHYDASE
jgi:hypothetical protein